MGLIFNHLSASSGFLDGQSRNAGAISGSMYFEPGGGEATGGSNDHAKRGFPGHKDAAYVFSGSAAAGATDKAVFLGHVVVSGSLSLGGGSTFLEGTGGVDKVAIFQDADTVVTGGLAFDETNDRLFIGDVANNPSQVLLGSGSVLFHHLGTEGGTVSGISTSANNLKLGLTSSHAGGQVELAGAGGVTIGSNTNIGMGINSVGHLGISTGSGGGSNQITFNPAAAGDTGNGALTSNITMNAQVFGIDASGNITIDSDAAVTLGGASIDVDSDGGTITVDAGANAISIGSNGTDAGDINVGTSTGSRTITVGNAVLTNTAEVELNAARIDINAGANGLQVDAGAASEIRTSAGRLVIDGKTGVQIQEDGGVVIEVDNAKDVNLGVAGRFVNVLGNLMVQGTTTAVTSSNTTIADPIIGLGITGSEGFNNLGDRALIFGKAAAAGDFLPAIKWDGTKFELGTFDATPLSSSMGAVKVAAPISAGALTSAALTDNRVVIAGTDGILEDDASLTFDGSDLQLADNVGLVLSSDDAEKIESDGTDLKIQTGGLIKLLSANTSGGDVEEFLRFASGSTVVEIQPQGTVADTDLVFKESGGNEIFRVDASADSILVNTTRKIEFADANSHISNPGAGLKLVDHAVIELEAATSVQLDTGVVDFEDDAVELQFGADGATLLSHVDGSGLLLKGGEDKLGFVQDDFAECIHSSANGLLDLEAGTAVLIAAGGSGETLRVTSTGIVPASDNAINLGATGARFNNIFTGDLNLRNDRGDWTLIEEEDFISFRNNMTGRRFRMVMEDITGTGTYGPGNDGEM